jgi:uncharacterized protein YxjI
MSKIEILNAENVPVATIKQKFKFFKPTFTISDVQGQQIAVIDGDWKAWNFMITSNDNQQIGTISKKWNGILKEAFTTADKYIVSVNPALQIDIVKTIIVSAAITIDMVLKESA